MNTMKQRWLNDGEPDANGFYEVVIENREGKVITRYRSKVMKELVDMALESQVEANRQIGRLMKPDRGRVPLKLEPRELTDGDTLRIAQELDDPNPTKRVGAVKEIIEASVGGNPTAIASEINSVSQERSDDFYRREAEAFVAAHPEYYPVAENQNLLFRELMGRQIDLTRNNLTIVYNDLLEKGELVAWPEDGPPPVDGEEEPVSVAPDTAPAPRPRRIQSIATGIRNSDANGSPPRPVPKKTVTRAEVENMSRTEYMTRLRDPDFRKAVDAMA
jgi:hypothetical protein